MALSPTEGFLLSRIDGHTPWAVLREIGGLLPEEADLALEGWLQRGLVLLDADSPSREKPRAPEAPAKIPQGRAASAAGSVDPSLDLAPELQEEIVALEQRLASASYHELLGVERGAEGREIKRAYFQLSKRFHPDRYFRRNIGDHAARLENIFKHVALAYELLSDPATRQEIERSMDSGPPPVGPEAGAYRGAEAGRSERIGREAKGYRTPSRMENLERLRSRFKMPKKVLAERRFKAGQFFQSARVAVHEKRWLEAAASARLAIAFDPWNREYKEQFASIQAEVHAARASELLEQADGVDVGSDALKLLEEAIHYRPVDAALHGRAARIAFDTGDYEKAREFAESACELAPEDAEHHLTLARALRRQGDTLAAMEALKAAAKISPQHPEIAAERKLLRRGR